MRIKTTKITYEESEPHFQVFNQWKIHAWLSSNEFFNQNHNASLLLKHKIEEVNNHLSTLFEKENREIGFFVSVKISHAPAILQQKWGWNLDSKILSEISKHNWTVTSQQRFLYFGFPVLLCNCSSHSNGTETWQLKTYFGFDQDLALVFYSTC